MPEYRLGQRLRFSTKAGPIPAAKWCTPCLHAEHGDLGGAAVRGESQQRDDCRRRKTTWIKWPPDSAASCGETQRLSSQAVQASCRFPASGPTGPSASAAWPVLKSAANSNGSMVGSRLSGSTGRQPSAIRHPGVSSARTLAPQQAGRINACTGRRCPVARPSPSRCRRFSASAINLAARGCGVTGRQVRSRRPRRACRATPAACAPSRPPRAA